MNKHRNKKFTCFAYGEGGNEKKYWEKLFKAENLQFHLNKWRIIFDNASGGSPATILDKCKKEVSGLEYDLILVFVDLDILKTEFALKYQKEVSALEKKYLNFKIIWQENNLEDELKKVNPKLRGKNKFKINKYARSNVNQYINSDLTKKVINVFKKKEAEILKRQ